MSSNKETSFEKDLDKLEGIVAKLEDGGLPLEESLSLFEEGQQLLKQCRDKLEKAQVKVSRLMENNTTEPVDPEQLGRDDG